MTRDKSVAHETAANRAKRLPGITSLAKRGNWDEAYESLYAVRDEVSSMGLWYFQADQTGMLNHFEVARRAIEEEVTKRRVAAAQESMKQEIEQLLPDLDGLVSRVRAAAESIRSTGMADFGGEMFSGPQLVQRFGEEWKNSLVAAMQCCRAQCGAPRCHSGIPTCQRRWNSRNASRVFPAQWWRPWSN